MKKKLTALLLALTTAFAFGHGGVELGPNKGRILELSKDESMHAEVTVKDGKFHVALLDKDLKPVKVEAQSLTATSATAERGKATKLEVTKAEGGFTVPVVKDGSWLILQYKETAKSKAVTARLHYDTGNCDACSKPEWLCECSAADETKDEKKPADKKADKAGSDAAKKKE
jgi:hypothetical protein